MSGLERFRKRLCELLTGALAAEQVDELSQLLREIGQTVYVRELVQTVQSDPQRGYGRLKLLVDGRAELALVVMRPGEIIRPHDHGVYEDGVFINDDEPAVGLVSVVQGEELNRFYSLNDEQLIETGSLRVKVGESLEISPTLIHSVENVGSVTAASLHAYIYAQDDPATRKRRFSL